MEKIVYDIFRSLLVVVLVLLAVTGINQLNKRKMLDQCVRDRGISIETISRAWVCKAQDKHIIWVKG